MSTWGEKFRNWVARELHQNRDSSGSALNNVTSSSQFLKYFKSHRHFHHLSIKIKTLGVESPRRKYSRIRFIGWFAAVWPPRRKLCEVESVFFWNDEMTDWNRCLILQFTYFTSFFVLVVDSHSFLASQLNDGCLLWWEIWGNCRDGKVLI